MASLRKLTKRFFIIANIAVVILFLLGCANAFLHPGKWWVISFLGLFFPLLLLLVLGFFVFWLFFSWRYSLISVLAMIIGWQNIHAFLAFNITKHLEQKPANAFRILSWNVRSWDEFITKKAGASGHRDAMMQFIQQQNADVLCLQEFLEPHGFKQLEPNISYIREQLHYPYYFFSHDHLNNNGKIETGVIIFSRYPILDTIQIKYNRDATTNVAESLIGVDLSINNKKIRVYTTHLQSVLFRSKDFRNVEIIRNVEEDSMIDASKSLLKKLRTAFRLRGDQADMVRKELDQSPYPEIICGDFNDVPNSYTYFHIRGDRQDAFIKKGFGIGRTYIHLSPTLRIDYIMADRQFTVLQCGRLRLPYSDHHPVIADLNF